jgi:hypothetical protein
MIPQVMNQVYVNKAYTGRVAVYEVMEAADTTFEISQKSVGTGMEKSGRQPVGAFELAPPCPSRRLLAGGGEDL